MKLVSFVVSVVMLLASHALLAGSVETYQFSKPDYEVRFHELNKILRCPKCQNQNLADSNSMISQDLRREVYRLMEEGRSDEQIMEFMVMRYGDFVLYKPKMDDTTYFLWYGPIGFGVLGLFILAMIVLRQRNKLASNQEKHTNSDEELSAKEQKALDEILKD